MSANPVPKVISVNNVTGQKTRFTEELGRTYVAQPEDVHVICLQTVIDGRGDEHGSMCQKLLCAVPPMPYPRRRAAVQKEEQRNEVARGERSGLVHPMNDLQTDRARKERRAKSEEVDRAMKSHCASHITPPLRVGCPRSLHRSSAYSFRSIRSTAAVFCFVSHCKSTFCECRPGASGWAMQDHVHG